MVSETSESKLSKLKEAVFAVYGRKVEESDDLFDLGGSSLQAVDLLARFEEIVGKEVSMQALIDAESIESLLERLSK